MASGRKQLADAIHRTAKDHAQRGRVGHQIGVIKKLKPLLVDPTDLDYNLDDDDIVLSQWVRAYKENTGLKVGDNLILHRAGGHWVAVDVIADKKRPLKVKRKKRKKGKGKEEEDTTEVEYEDDTEQGEDEALEAQEEKILEEGTAKSETEGIVVHNGDHNVPRPEGFATVKWIGWEEPYNAIDGDTWINPGKAEA